MKSLYITSVERYSGKTATCLALGQDLQDDGYRVGYLKPLSLQPFRMEGHIADEDAAFVKNVLGLEVQAWELSPVVITPEVLREHLRSQQPPDLMPKVRATFEAVSAGKDIVLLEGGASLREGYVMGLPTPAVAEALSSHVLVVVKYHDEVQLMDDVLASKTRLGRVMSGILINRVPREAVSFVTELATPKLESTGIPVFGMLPEESGLAALTVGELSDTLNAEYLTRYRNPGAVVENLVVGAMSVDAALSRFRKQLNKAVITGGDRTDIQLAALETSTSCLILTGNLRPSPLVVRQAEEFGVTVMLVQNNTMETIERIEAIYGKTHLGQPAKLKQFRSLLDSHLDFKRLYQAIGLQKDAVHRENPTF